MKEKGINAMKGLNEQNINELLSLAVQNMLQEQHNNITLGVACENENALTIYKKSGFEGETAYDYYGKKIMGNENREETI